MAELLWSNLLSTMTKKKHLVRKFELPVPERRSGIKQPKSAWTLEFPDEDRDRIVDEDSYNNPPDIPPREAESKNLKYETRSKRS